MSLKKPRLYDLISTEDIKVSVKNILYYMWFALIFWRIRFWSFCSAENGNIRLFLVGRGWGLEEAGGVCFLPYWRKKKRHILPIWNYNKWNRRKLLVWTIYMYNKWYFSVFLSLHDTAVLHIYRLWYILEKRRHFPQHHYFQLCQITSLNIYKNRYIR